MTVVEALKAGYCKQCNSYQAIQKVFQCVATRMPSLNYRNTPVGQCALTEEEMMRRRGK